MIYQSSHQTPTMSFIKKTSPKPQHRNLQTSLIKCAKSKRTNERMVNADRCRGRCRVQWSVKHVKDGLVLVQEAQLARVVKTSSITDHYEIDAQPFASGQWTKVYRCRSRSTGILYAAKYSSRNRFNADCSAELRHEIALLSLCSQSPRVIRLHDVYETPREIILVMEYAPGGDLQTLIDGDLVPLEGDVVHFVRQLVEGLAYLHERNIAHLDIKPQNLVMMGTFPECNVKLCDFEISRVILEGTEVREILGTPDYVAPEILHYEPITLAADMWSLGVTTYVLLTGFSPFGGETDQETFQNISFGEVDFPEELFEDVSAQAKDFLAKLLVLDPSTRMTAKQCLHHGWLRGAPMQASPHLRKYLSKSREVLLERVVNRENFRRAAALISQTTSQANLSTARDHDQNRQGLSRDCLLSQSEICLNHCSMESRSSLAGSEGFPSPADSQTSLNSSRTSLSCTSQSCLLNKEQTQGLLNKAQSRSQANLNQDLSRGLLSRIRSLNHVQSQACLLNGYSTINSGQISTVTSMNPIITKSREKLYGLRSLSKSQGMLDIYRSLESLKHRKENAYGKELSKTGDILPIARQLSIEIASSNGEDHRFADIKLNPIKDAQTMKQNVSRDMKINLNNGNQNNACVDLNSPMNDMKMKNNVEDLVKMPKRTLESEENLDSLKSVESDTLTEDSDEMTLNRNVTDNDKRPCQRQHSDASTRSNNSGASDDKDDRSTESENEEPKYTVAQLVSAFNKHQEVASKMSLKAIMCEKRNNELTFPTGTKALRLFIPDIDITENKIIRRKTSYKPRKNWEELRKRNEKNEGVLKSFNLNDSGNEDDDDKDETADNIRNNFSIEQENEQNFTMNIKKDIIDEISQGLTSQEEDTNLSSKQWTSLQPEESIFVDNANNCSNLDLTIDEKYKLCVKSAQPKKMDRNEDKINKYPKPLEMQSKITILVHQPERLPRYVYTNINPRIKNNQRKSNRMIIASTNEKLKIKSPKVEEIKSDSSTDIANVNLKDILQQVDNFQNKPKENLENLRKRTSITKIILNDNLIHDNSDSFSDNRINSQIKAESFSNDNQFGKQTKLLEPSSFIRSSSLSSDSSCLTPSSVQSDVNISWEDVQVAASSSVLLEKEDTCRMTKNNDIQRTYSEGRNRQCVSDKKIWGRVCTGSYNRAMEKFTNRNIDASKKSLNLSLTQQTNKYKRKNNPAISQYIHTQES